MFIRPDIKTQSKPLIQINMKNRKQQSTARAIKRHNKIVVQDKTTESGIRIVNVPRKFKQDFINKNKKRTFSDEELQESKIGKPE